MRVCIPITANNVSDAIEDIKKAQQKADLLELRIDFIDNIDVNGVEEMLAATSKPAIVTCRKAGEGGKWKGTEEERLSLIRETAKLSPTYIDVELSIGEELHNLGRAIKEGGTKLIISHHDFERTPSYEDLSSIVEKQYAYGADIAKVACMGTSMADNVKVFRLISDNVARGREVIGLVMGRYGKLSRVASPMLGAHLTFASLESGKESAPGQLSIDEMRRAYELLS